MKTDSQPKADVTTELAWDAAGNPIGIGIMVKNGDVAQVAFKERIDGNGAFPLL